MLENLLFKQTTHIISRVDASQATHRRRVEHFYKTGIFGSHSRSVIQTAEFRIVAADEQFILAETLLLWRN
jgi:hypothetical protein